MSTLAINPIRIPGPWSLGVALDRHTLYSEFLGYDSAGRSQFNTVRTALGEAIYIAKYKGDRSRIAEISETAAVFIRDKVIPTYAISVICPVPPSKTGRPFQPVIEIARSVGEALSIPMDADSISRQPPGTFAKDMPSYEERKEMVEKGLSIRPNAFTRKIVLLIDDLHQTGATAETIARACKAVGGATDVIFMAITKTRT